MCFIAEKQSDKSGTITYYSFIHSSNEYGCSPKLHLSVNVT